MVRESFWQFSKSKLLIQDLQRKKNERQETKWQWGTKNESFSGYKYGLVHVTLLVYTLFLSLET